MRIVSVVIDKETVFKIYKKHGVKFTEVKSALLANPYIVKTKFERYVAIGKAQRCLTVVFSFEQGIAEIITAYPSSDWQIKLYKDKR
ncbi:BrnT family toxin [Candidatus Woesearchaeota archaeon]|nr:BrnT family toxin [Candidatus Woesearchaeota archaeon]